MTADRPVTLAVVTGAHGVTGEVRLKLFTDNLFGFERFNAGTLTLTALRGNIARFAEVADRTTAEALRGTELSVPRGALPPLAEGEYYHVDLIGLPCIATSGEAIGTCVAVENFGAGDVIEIEKADGGRFMVPMNADAVPAWGAEIVISSHFLP